MRCNKRIEHKGACSDLNGVSKPWALGLLQKVCGKSRACQADTKSYKRRLLYKMKQVRANLLRIGRSHGGPACKMNDEPQCKTVYTCRKWLHMRGNNQWSYKGILGSNSNKRAA